MRAIPAVLALLSLAPPGCGQSAPHAEYRNEIEADLAASEVIASARSAYPAEAPAPPMDRAMAFAEPMMGMMGGMMGGAPGADAQAQDAPPLDDSGITRRIIYDASIDLLVEDLDPAADRLVELVQAHDAYIAEEDTSGAPGSKRTGRWKLRVPVDRFEEFVRELLAIGELVRNHRTSQEVTEQFYDLEAQVRSKKVEEETLLKILEERSGALEDVLKVQVELSRTRGEIERLEGRLRVLDNLTSLATVTLSLREREDYAPTAPVVPDYPTRLARTWSASITELRTTGENLGLWAVNLAPKLPFYLVGFLVAFLVARFLWRRLVRAWPRIWELARRPIGPPQASP